MIDMEKVVNMAADAFLFKTILKLLEKIDKGYDGFKQTGLEDHIRQIAREEAQNIVISGMLSRWVGKEHKEKVI